MVSWNKAVASKGIARHLVTYTLGTWSSIYVLPEVMLLLYVQSPTSNSAADSNQQKVEEQHQTISQLQQQLQSMTQQFKQLQADSSSVTQASATQHQDSLATLEGQHQTALRSLSALSAQHAELQKQHEALARQSEKHKADWDAAALSLSTAQHQNSALSTQMVELQKQHAEETGGMSAIKNEHEALSRQHAALQVKPCVAA